MGFLGNILGNVQDDDEEKRPTVPVRIAAPGATTGMPAANLRGLPPANPTAAGVSPQLAPTPVASPSPALAKNTAADEQQLEHYKTTGSGVSQVARAHPVGGGILRGLNTAGTILSGVAPRLRPILSAIPGTEEHHSALINRTQGRIGEDLGNQGKESAIGKTEADTTEAEARARLASAQADVAKNPKEGLTPEETTIHDLMAGENGQPRINPQTGKPFTYLEAYTAVQQAKQDVRPEKDPPLADKVPQLNQMLGSRYQVLNPGQALPQQYSLPAGATQKDYDRIDKALEAEERARGTKAQQDQANEMRRQTLAIAQQNQDMKVGKEATTANATVHAFTRYQNDFRELAPQLTEDDRKAMEVLTSHADVAQGFLAKATSGVLDTLFGEPLTGYSEKAMSGIMTKDQYDKLSPAGKKMLADYFNAIVQNFANMKQMMGSVGRNAMQLQAEINTIPLPYLDGQTAEAQFSDKLDDINIRNSKIPGYEKVEVKPTNAQPQNTQKPRPANVPAGYIYNANGPKGPGWYKPNAAK